MKQPEIVFYTRSRCPLCDKAKEVIVELKKEYDFTLIEKDIDESDELTEKYGLMIPVVEIDGSEVQFGHIDAITLSEALTEKN
ncbi:glutaredoxin family protein [Bacillus sp. CMF12]|uniref:glutaredoxin family protein n=1 Tax=Bacillaceae TaxID=186817 RepID=UPI001FB333D8|nr:MULTISPECIES: glutaredoxin family protein [Bacillaceae]UOE55020.1 glutaredoxin family protein [Cytobacillus oceanisediminis]USK49478.1 glutaredoxin family protein [Bacillus sp. CMF12]